MCRMRPKGKWQSLAGFIRAQHQRTRVSAVLVCDLDQARAAAAVADLPAGEHRAIGMDDPATHARLMNDIPAGRPGTPEEIAEGSPATPLLICAVKIRLNQAGEPNGGAGGIRTQALSGWYSAILFRSAPRDTPECTTSTSSPENRHLSAQFDCLPRIRTLSRAQAFGEGQTAAFWEFPTFARDRLNGSYCQKPTFNVSRPAFK